MTKDSFPARARVAIIGGGVVGCGVAYYLAKAGCTEVVLLEANELSSGTTWGSSALVTHFTSTPFITRLHKETLDLWAALEAESGQPTGLHLPGSLRLATSAERMKEYRRYIARAELLGVAMRLIGRDEVKALNPLLDVADLAGAAHTPDDGYVEPASATNALAAAARKHGARIVRGCTVTGIERAAGAWRLATNRGTLAAETVVCAAGMWAPTLGRMLGLTIPVVAMERLYTVTEAVPELKAIGHEIPVLRDPDGTFYMRQETDALLVGPYERRPRRWDVTGLPPQGGQQALPPYLDEATEPLQAAMARVPVLQRLGLRSTMNVPTSRSPDGNPLLGPVDGCPGLFLAAGFFAGLSEVSVCKYLAQWIMEGEPGIDLWPFDARRYGDYATKEYAWARTKERHVVGLTQEISYPGEEMRAGRPAKASPLYARLERDGAVFGARFGWEVANWFAAPGEEPADRLSFERPNWFAAAAREAEAVAQAVGIADWTAIAKIEVAGAGAKALLDHVCASDVPGKAGKVRPFLWLSPKGRIAGHGSLACLSPARYLLTAPPEAERHHADWLRRHAEGSDEVSVRVVTARFGALLVAGPQSAELLAAVLGQVPPADRSLADGVIGTARVRLVPNWLTGAAAWEVHCPLEHLLGVYAMLMATGAEMGARNLGWRAIDGLRLEAGQPLWGRELGADAFAGDAGLEKRLAAGKDHVGAARAGDRSGRRLATLVIDAGTADCWGAEPILAGGKPVALVRSAAYGHRIKRSLATATLPDALAVPGTALEVDILGERRRAVVTPRPLEALGGED